MTDLSIFFNPKSIAIIGASDALRFGYATTKYLLNSNFKTFAVNPMKSNLMGHKCFEKIQDIMEDIELAIILVGNDKTLQAVRDCAEKGVRGIIIESAGFAETGIEKYIEIQKKIVEVSKQHQIRIIGPNCVGVTNFNNQFTSTDVNFERIPTGGISIIAQSGVLGNIFLDWASSEQIGFSKSITLGNKIDVDEVDMIEYLENDPDTKVITIYLEGTKRGKVLIETLNSTTKPVIILKNGRSELGANAVQSHTGSIAGNDRIYDSVFKKFPNVFRVNNFYEMFHTAEMFATQPKLTGKNVAVITGSGSLGILTCDLIEKYNLSLANLSQKTVDAICAVKPDWVNINGTIDLGPSMFTTLIPSLKAVFDDENVDCVLFIYSVPRWPIEMFNIPVTTYFKIMKLKSIETQKPIVCVCFGSQWVYDYIQKAINKVKKNIKIPIIKRLKYAIKGFKMMHDYCTSIDKKI
ncbi:MAG: acetate--CoA ligase family protein [Promethearchaeota archaeon]